MSKRKTREEHLEEARVDERFVKQIKPNERVVMSEGKAGEERIKRIIEGDGTVYHYTGERGEEKMVMVEAYADSSGFRRVCHYEGEKGQERLVIVEHSNGHVTHYCGCRHQEFKHHVVFVSGNILYFTGERKNERKYKQVDKDGTITFFKGEQESEYYSSVLHPDGEYAVYTGTKGCEKMLRSMDSSGTVTAYAQGDTSVRTMPLRVCHWSASGEMVHYTDDNPLATLKEKNAALNAAISASLERAEKLHDTGDSNENGYLVMSQQLKQIHAAAADLFASSKAGHRIETVDVADPRLQRIGEGARDADASETSESED